MFQSSKSRERFPTESAPTTTAALARQTRRAFLLVLFTPLLLGLIVFWEVRSYQQDVAWVNHTKDVLAANDHLLLAVTRAESADRGFLITNDESFLERFAKAERGAQQQMAVLAKLTADNKDQQHNLRRLETLVRERFSGFNQLIQLRRHRSLVVGNVRPFLSQSSELTNDLLSQASIVAAEEERLLQIRRQAKDATGVALASSFTLCILVNIAALVWAYRLITEYAHARELAAEQIQGLNANLEARVAERTSELETVNEHLRRSNADLTKFAYIASHDLQEPLRTIGSYVGLLSHRYQGKLDDQADKYIKFVVEGAKRMQNLVQDLLQYSRVGTEPLNVTTLDMNVLMQTVRSSLEYAIHEQQGVITNGPLPTVRGDATKLTQVVSNLITNAIKFRKPGQPPHVEVQAIRQGPEWIFSVKDNGIGFEQEYSERIFAIFQRLHGVGAYPGTGMGLAICKRVVELHGGRIWATSDGVSGSTFSFTLPLQTVPKPTVQQSPISSDKIKGEVVPR